MRLLPDWSKMTCLPFCPHFQSFLHPMRRFFGVTANHPPFISVSIYLRYALLRLVILIAEAASANMNPNSIRENQFLTDQSIERANQPQTEFRFNAASAFLTFPHADFNRQEFIDQLHRRRPIEKYVICREKHQDGDWHVHACIKFCRKLNTTDVRFFDFDGKHPNISSVRNWKLAVKYCKKGDNPDFLQSGIEESNERVSPDDLYAEAIRSSSTPEGFIRSLEQVRPRDSVVFSRSIKEFAFDRYRPPEQPYRPSFDPLPFINVPDAARQWAERYLEGESTGRPKSLCLVGPSRIGKTAWARSLGPHIYLNSYYTLDKFFKPGNYIVLDDIPFERFPPWKAIVGCQEEFELTDKYKPKKTIKNWNKPCIICCNDDMYPPSNTVKPFSRPMIDFWEKNVITVVCTENFY